MKFVKISILALAMGLFIASCDDTANENNDNMDTMMTEPMPPMDTMNTPPPVMDTPMAPAADTMAR